MAIADETLTVKLKYAVEQYGVLTGPFDIHVQANAEMLHSHDDPWRIIMSTKPLYNRVFDHFFPVMDLFLSNDLGIYPLHEVRTVAKRQFEMYFPAVFYDPQHQSFANIVRKK